MTLPANWATGNSFGATAENAVETAVNALSAFTSQTANYTLQTADRFVAANAVSGPITQTLPTAVGCAGRQYIVEKADPSVNVVTVATTASQTINGVTSQLLVFPNHRISVVSTGSNWLIELNNYVGTQLGYAELDAPYSVTNYSPTTAASYKISGLSVTTVGTGRPVSVRFSGQAYSTTVDAFVVAQLLINNSVTGGVNASVSSPTTSVYRSLSFEASPVLTAGTSYTFEVGIWNQSSTTAVVYADLTTPAPITFVVEGK